MNQSVSEQRSKNYLKQLKGSFVFKVLAVLASFLLVPIMIKYLGTEQYGVWSTLLSIISWIVLFDLGIGNGLRNKISESIAKKNRTDVQKYISTSYVVIGLISIILICIFLIINTFIHWQGVFNTSILTDRELSHVVGISAVFIFINFWISLINQVLNGLQQSSITVFNQFLSNFLSLLLIYLLSLFTQTSLLYLAILYGTSLVASNIGISIWFYNKNREFIPIHSLFEKSFLKSIMSLGFKFFIIQIAVIVIFTTDKILITQLFGPEYVTSYDVVFKLFSIITILHSLLMAPLWSAYSDAYHREDLEWIKTTIKKQLKIYILFIVATIALMLLAKPVIKLWVGDSVSIDNMLIIAMGLFIIVSTWNNIFGYVIGGMGHVRLGSYYTVITAMINIPLSYFFAIVLDFGLSGIIYGTISSIIISAIMSPIQVYYFVFSNFKNELFTRILK